MRHEFLCRESGLRPFIQVDPSKRLRFAESDAGMGGKLLPFEFVDGHLGKVLSGRLLDGKKYKIQVKFLRKGFKKSRFRGPSEVLQPLNPWP